MRGPIVALLCLIPCMGFAKEKVKVFAPENKLHLFDNVNKDSNIDEATFNAIVDQVGEIFKPIVEQFGGNLVMEKDWNDSTVNAYANQDGNKWIVHMFGGLARRDEVTPDGFALVVCHELGHHLAGFPFYEDTEWAASEGQSDYFATQACAHKIWGGQDEANARFRDEAPEYVKNLCNEQWATAEEQNLCYRSAMAGKSLANLLAALGSEEDVDFETPDRTRVESTDTAHPAGQCRLDTYFQGALCNVAFDFSIIPGRNSTGGQDSLESEKAASVVSCTMAGGHKLGLRPRCWYSPRLSLNVDEDNIQQEEVEGNGNEVWEPGEVFGVNVPVTNNLVSTIEGATLSLVSSSEEVTVGAASVYPAISVGETKFAETPVSVAVSETMSCGATFDLKAVIAAEGIQPETDLKFILGELRQVGQFSATPGTSIPDADEAGVTEVANIEASAMAQQAVVYVDIAHTYLADLIVSLVSPAGKEYLLHDRVYSSDRTLKKEFKVDIEAEDSAGEWKLVVKDILSEDVGTINAWSLSVKSAFCGNGLKVTAL